ncbi:MAG: hypothetical protein JW825_03195 [Candidatus Methanofastidiosa archaeon]|nr:hypothetical protein [Candidatus Methanofastidiosa archaeon]
MYHTETEEKLISIIRNGLKADKVINPYDFKGKKKEALGQFLRDSDMVVGLSIYEKYPYIVWSDLEYGASLEKEIYTINFPSDRESTFVLRSGFYDEFPRLSLEETDILYSKIMKDDSKGLLSRLFFGRLGRKTIF